MLSRVVTKSKGAQMRDHATFESAGIEVELFADLFGSRRGRPSVPAEVMASVITLQRCTACPITRPSMR